MKLSSLLIALALMLLAAGLGYFFGQTQNSSRPLSSCAELGVAYLELGKEQLGITDFGSSQWQALIEQETQFVNDCQAFLGRLPVNNTHIRTFDDCAAAGYPVMESYPEQCMTPDGRSFTREIEPEIPIDPDGIVFCTMDAKICPDGSAVGRTGPNCEFAPCPGE